MPKLVSQETVYTDGEKVERWGIQVKAVNKFAAKQRARAFARRQDIGIKNILRPKVTSENSVQSTFNELFPEQLNREKYTVDVMVII